MDFFSSETLQALLESLRGNRFIYAGTIVLVSLVLAKVVDWAITRGVKVWARRTETDLDDRLIELLHRPVFVTVVLIGLYMATYRVALPDAFETFVLRALKTLAVIIWVVFALRTCSLLVELLDRLEEKSSVIQPRTLSLFNTVAKLIVVGAGTYFLFLTWGVDVGALLVSGGIIGIAVGFAAKDTLANLFSGIFILADAPYQIGDFINLDSGERGQVTHVGLRSTRLLTRDDIEVTVPNAVIANAKIINESGGPWEKERVRIPIGVAYGSDIDRVRDILMGIAEEDEHLDEDPPPRVRFRAFGDSSLQFELLGWIHEPVLRGRVIDDLNCKIYKRFRAEGIEIPYPKRDVYLHRAGDAVEG